MPRLQADNCPIFNVGLLAFNFSRIRTSIDRKRYICVISRPPLDPFTHTNLCIMQGPL